MDKQKSLNHAKWDCKYRVVFIPKWRRKSLYRDLRPSLGGVFRRLGKQKVRQIEEGHLRADQMHIMIDVPPRYAVSQVIGISKGESADHLGLVYGERKRNFAGQYFWALGFYASTVGRDEVVIRQYIRKQEQQDKRLDPRGDERPPEGGPTLVGSR